MFIKNIFLEGFKSYSKLVSVPNFDRHFNAITGLNGSGKSNILDSICFIFGITNLSKIRVSCLRELIYKNGQTGVLKASVIVIFDNSDKIEGMCPLGYEKFDEVTVMRQVIIGGKNKYFINEKLVDARKVLSMFHSVRLNVNNPHFIIMQGRITKVLNAKPYEILGMLEESTGTRIYEKKKEIANKIIEKNEIKMIEIQDMLRTEILPNMQKIKEDKAIFQYWQEAKREIEHFKRVLIACECLELERIISDPKELNKQIKTDLEKNKTLHQSLYQSLLDKDLNIKYLESEKKKKNIEPIQKRLECLNRNFTEDFSKKRDLQVDFDFEKLNLKKLEKTLFKLTAENIKNHIYETSKNVYITQTKFELAKNSLEITKSEFSNIKIKSCINDWMSYLKEVLTNAKNIKYCLEAEIKIWNIQITHIEREIMTLKSLIAHNKDIAEKTNLKFQNNRQVILDIANQISIPKLEKDTSIELESAYEKEKQLICKCKGRLNTLETSTKIFNFNFKYPGVFGVVAKLIWVKEAAATIAIDVIAGGKLFNVVVDTEKNAQKLLTHGQIRHRITIIPLNKISKIICNDEIIHKVTKNFHGKAKLALDFIGYDKSLFNAMCHIFGNAFICDDAATARNVAFNKETLTRCVTLNGDDFNPLGLVSGGYRQKRRSVLNILCEIQKVQFDLKAHSTKINGIKEQILSLYRLNKEKTKLYQKLGLSIHSLELIKTLFIDSELYKKNEHILKFEKSLIDNRLSHDITFLKLLKLRFMIKAIEKEINIRKHNNSLKEEKRIERKLVRKKQIAGKAKTNLSIDNETISTLQAGREKTYLVGLRLENDLLNTREILCCSEVNIKYNERQSCRILNAIHLEEENLINYNSHLRLCNLKISELSKSWKLQQDKLTMLEIKKREYIKREKEIQVEQEFAMKKLNSILSTNLLNIEECHSICYSYKIFGSLTQIKEKVSKDLLKSEKEKMKLEKRVNKKALSLCIQMEEEYNALELKKSIVLSERKKIENVIKDLDYVKEKLVKKAWNKVNKDFGSIFATLLPGASARLTEPKGQTFMNGLEVNVAFENTWKQSLNELSGGQRSLLSLSLVLALLLFKPAPIYILDEVDAALDLNHTQNLSKMIKKHFPQSQFIIVSLKEEMFKNANVLYTTKFLNGLSTVIRTSQMEKNV